VRTDISGGDRVSDVDGRAGRRRRRNGGKNVPSIKNEKSANVEMNDAPLAFAAISSKKQEKVLDKRRCDYCDRTGHVIDKCFFNPENPTINCRPMYFTVSWC
jgi:hypothetical protein